MAAPTSRTDVTSSDFDPLLALSEESDVELPYPDIRPFNNLAEYESFVSGQKVSHKIPADTKQEESVKPKTGTQPLSQEPSTSTEVQEPSAPVGTRKIYNNVLTKMEKSYSKGPMGVLYRCVQERIKVKVWTRNYTKIRGICTGYILAFDKHWNLAMADVDEVYLKPRKTKIPVYGVAAETDPNLPPPSSEGESSQKTGSQRTDEQSVPTTPQRRLSRAGSHPLQTKDPSVPSFVGAASSRTDPEEPSSLKNLKTHKNRRKKYDPCQRHVGQLFIRGDNVVIVALVYL